MQTRKPLLWTAPALLLVAVLVAACVFFMRQAQKPAGELSCTVSVRCDTILENMDLLDPEKAELVPENGELLAPTEVSFTQGESAFDALRRVCREKNIHMEFSETPLYESVYIEGIGNLYEFDAGELSGWMYKVNGEFPNFGSSKYELADGDVVQWVYTCDLGADVGGGLQNGT